MEVLEGPSVTGDGRARVLVVEDNLVAVTVFKKKLCATGLTESVIDVVASGEEGIDLVTTLFVPPSLV